MKARFLALLAAVAVGSAAVLIYASQSRTDRANAALTAPEEAPGDCDACEMSATKPAVTASVSANDGCSAKADMKPAVATLSSDGCPYVPGEAMAAKVADVQPAQAANSACCADEGAAPAVAAQIEK